MPYQPKVVISASLGNGGTRRVSVLSWQLLLQLTPRLLQRLDIIWDGEDVLRREFASWCMVQATLPSVQHHLSVSIDYLSRSIVACSLRSGGASLRHLSVTAILSVSVQLDVLYSVFHRVSLTIGSSSWCCKEILVESSIYFWNATFSPLSSYLISSVFFFASTSTT